MQISIEDESKALLTNNEEESEKEPTMKDTPNAVSDSACCSRLNSETVATEKARAVGEAETDVKEKVWHHYEKEPIQVPQTGFHGNVEHDEEFTAKDLLGFAWQIARGMVSVQGHKGLLDYYVCRLLFFVDGILSHRFYFKGCRSLSCIPGQRSELIAKSINYLAKWPRPLDKLTTIPRLPSHLGYGPGI